MKKIAVIMLAVLLLCVPCMTAFAVETSSDSATVTTAVPSTHKVTFIVHNGRIENNGTAVGDTAYYNRQSVQSYVLIPDKDNNLERVLYNNENVTAQVRNGIFTAPPLTANAVLEVFYGESEPERNVPESFISKSSDIKPVVTGDLTDVWILALFGISVVSAVLIILTCKRKPD